MSEAYKAAGVDLQLGDDLSNMLYEAAKQTWANRAGQFGEPTSSVDAFRGLRDISLAPLLNAPKPEGIRQFMCDDGVGTKVEIAHRVGRHDTVAYDLLAMVTDDAAIKGYEPAAVSTTLDVRKLKKDMAADMQQLAQGYIQAAAVAEVAIVNGEVAELGDLVGRWDADYTPHESFVYNWSATLLAAGHTERLLDGRAVRSGDALVGFQEQGFRSNGMSLVRNSFRKAYGANWHDRFFANDETLGEATLLPSTIYAPVLVEAIGGYDLSREQKVDIHGAAHITGGGIPGKLGDLLRTAGVGAVISDGFETPEIMQFAQNIAGISDREAHEVWNMGTGMIVATPEPEKLIAIARDHKVVGRQIGEIIRGNLIAIVRANQGKSDLAFDAS